MPMQPYDRRPGWPPKPERGAPLHPASLGFGGQPGRRHRGSLRGLDPRAPRKLCSAAESGPPGDGCGGRGGRRTSSRRGAQRRPGTVERARGCRAASLARPRPGGPGGFCGEPAPQLSGPAECGPHDSVGPARSSAPDDTSAPNRSSAPGRIDLHADRLGTGADRRAKRGRCRGSSRRTGTPARGAHLPRGRTCATGMETV